MNINRNIAVKRNFKHLFNHNIKFLFKFCYKICHRFLLRFHAMLANIQWLPEQMECGNPQIRKSAVAPGIPMTQKMIDTSFESPKCKL